jgi:hypothetical protein
MQRADTLRYLVLLVKGGIYSDTDTRLRKPPSKWGQGATLWADGKGLKKDERARIAAGEKWQDVLGPPSVVVGIEADVGERDDWNEWWPRPVSPLLIELGGILISDPNSSMDDRLSPLTSDPPINDPENLAFNSESNRLDS